MTQEEELEEQNKSPNILLYPRSPVNLHINLPSPPPFSCRPPSPSVSIDCRQRIYYSIYNQRPTTKHNGDDSCQGGGMKHIPWTTTTSDAMRDDTPGRVDCRDRRLKYWVGLGSRYRALSFEFWVRGIKKAVAAAAVPVSIVVPWVNYYYYIFYWIAWSGELDDGQDSGYNNNNSVMMVIGKYCDPMNGDLIGKLFDSIAVNDAGGCHSLGSQPVWAAAAVVFGHQERII